MLGHLLAALALLVAPSWAGFTNGFDGVTCGSDLVLTWDAVPPQYYPLCITAQVIDRNGDGFSANAYRVNITTGASGTSYTWEGVPYPLRAVVGGLYQLELRPMSWPGGDVPLLAKSPTFAIMDSGVVTRPDGSAKEPVPEDPQSESEPAISKAAAIGIGVAIGVVSIGGMLLVGWFLKKRRRRAATEKSPPQRANLDIC
ncbi:hypothetical protein VTH06DRAFT_2315 [Thermothelomyces fergusii]